MLDNWINLKNGKRISREGGISWRGGGSNEEGGIVERILFSNPTVVSQDKTEGVSVGVVRAGLTETSKFL